MAFNYKQKYAIEAKAKQKIKEYDCRINEDSGIYHFMRYDEEKGWCKYIGQAKHLLTRLAEHLTARQTTKGECSHIDNSLYKRGIISETNTDGWAISFYYCDIEELDTNERKDIEKAQANGVYLYNITSGGQNAGKYDINERRQTKLKRYSNGKQYGYEKARQEVKTIFDKYLDFIIKGKPNKTKEKKLQQFKEWLESAPEEENEQNGEQ